MQLQLPVPTLTLSLLKRLVGDISFVEEKPRLAAAAAATLRVILIYHLSWIQVQSNKVKRTNQRYKTMFR